MPIRSGPSTITRWVEFMNLFVADRIPSVPPLILGLSGALYEFLADAPALPVEQSQFVDYTSLSEAKADFRSSYKRTRLLMDNGAAIDGMPGAIGATWEMNYRSGPSGSTKERKYFLGRNGKLNRKKSGKFAKAAYTGDPSARPSADPERSQRIGLLGRPARLRMGTGLRRQRTRLDHAGAGQGPRHRWRLQPGRLGQVFGPRHRPPGDPDRGPA